MLELKDLKKGSHIHLMGICGVAMASLAGILKEMGYQVTGSDQNVYPPMSDLLKDLGIDIMQGYVKENLSPKPDFVIVGNVITKKHEEAIALMESDIPYTSLPKAMGDVVIDNRKSIVVSGTHGKTTTTSIMSWILESLGEEPGFLVGGIPKNFSKSFQIPKKNYFVIEGDEYDTAFFDKVPKFNYYKPYYVLLGAIEFDHADIYNDLNDIMDAFTGLAERANSEGCFIYYAENENTELIAKKAKSKKKFSYGFNHGDYQAKNVNYGAPTTQFDVFWQGKKIISVQTKLFGSYNVLNVLACVGLCHQLGFDLNQVANAIKNFEGVKRRQEILCEKNKVTLIEDFAHHPTAVSLTIDAVKKRYEKAQVHAVFEPRSATSKRNIFQEQYLQAFLGADKIWIKEPSSMEKIPVEERFSSNALVEALNKAGKKAHLFTDVKQGAKDIMSSVQQGDAIVVMSNGSFDGIYDLLKEGM